MMGRFLSAVGLFEPSLVRKVVLGVFHLRRPQLEHNIKCASTCHLDKFGSFCSFTCFFGDQPHNVDVINGNTPPTVYDPLCQYLLCMSYWSKYPPSLAIRPPNRFEAPPQLFSYLPQIDARRRTTQEHKCSQFHVLWLFQN